jgi:hypothetical protein
MRSSKQGGIRPAKLSFFNAQAELFRFEGESTLALLLRKLTIRQFATAVR